MYGAESPSVESRVLSSGLDVLNKIDYLVLNFSGERVFPATLSAKMIRRSGDLRGRKIAFGRARRTSPLFHPSIYRHR